jgi:hypothetical protein
MAQPLQVVQQQALPAEATQLAGTYQLGEPLADYRIGLTKRMRSYVVIGIVGAILFGALAVIIFTSPQDKDSMSSTLLFGLFALGCLGLVANNLRYPLLYKGWHVYVCKEGFIFTTGKKSEPFRWDAIAGVWLDLKSYRQYGMNVGTTYKYTVQRNDGEKLVLDDKFMEVDALGNTITQETTLHMLPRTLEDFNAGKVITFGPLSVDQQGVSNGKNTLSWSEVGGVVINSGRVIVTRRGKADNWLTMEVAKVPNVFVLDALVRSLVQK